MHSEFIYEITQRNYRGIFTAIAGCRQVSQSGLRRTAMGDPTTRLSAHYNYHS